MDKYIEELRDLNLDLEGLKARKEAIKKKALEHRDKLSTKKSRRRFALKKSKSKMKSKKSKKEKLR